MHTKGYDLSDSAIGLRQFFSRSGDENVVSTEGADEFLVLLLVADEPGVGMRGCKRRDQNVIIVSAAGQIVGEDRVIRWHDIDRNLVGQDFWLRHVKSRRAQRKGRIQAQQVEKMPAQRVPWEEENVAL